MYIRTQEGLGQQVKPIQEGRLTTEINDALRRGLWTHAVGRRVLAGNRDENLLTDMVFFARHPERQGRRLKRGEQRFKRLRQEWLDIRNLVVRPALGARFWEQDPTSLPVPPLDPTMKALTDNEIAEIARVARTEAVQRCRVRAPAQHALCRNEGALTEGDVIRRIYSLQKRQ
jgi:hypothetical protein